jgi:hypothetical protein
MSAAEKLKLRKELEKYHGFAKGLTRSELASGKWFGDFVEETLGRYSSVPSPSEIQARFPDEKTPDELADAVVTAAIHEAIAAADAYEKNLSGTEIRTLTEKKPARPDERLTGDAVALVAELAYTVRLDMKLLFDLAAAYSRQMNAGQADVIYELFARALGGVDVAEAKQAGDLARRVGAKIFERAIQHPLGSDLGDAQRKGFYCYLAKALSKEAKKLIPTLPAYEAPPKPEELTGPMSAAPVDDGLSFQS